MSAIDYDKESADRINWMDLTGGPAHGSKTMLDEFAIAALVGLGDDIVDEAQAAKWCYDMAEAMLAERAKRNGARSGQWHEVRGVTGKTYG